MTVSYTDDSTVYAEWLSVVAADLSDEIGAGGVDTATEIALAATVTTAIGCIVSAGNASGEPGKLAIHGRAPFKLGATVAAGAYVNNETVTGRWVAVTTTTKARGQILQGGGDGDIVPGVLFGGAGQFAALS